MRPKRPASEGLGFVGSLDPGVVLPRTVVTGPVRKGSMVDVDGVFRRMVERCTDQ